MQFLPCKDCIVFPICKYPQAEPLKRFKLIDKCSLLHKYFQAQLDPSSYQERLQDFYKYYGSKYY